MKKCSIYCEVKDCVNYGEGFCNLDDVNRVTMLDGVPMCADFKPINTAEKALLAKGLLQKIHDILKAEGDELEEFLGDFELSTDRDRVSYMIHKDDGNYLQDFACSEEIAALVDAYNVLTSGEIQRITWKK